MTIIIIIIIIIIINNNNIMSPFLANEMFQTWARRENKPIKLSSS